MKQHLIVLTGGGSGGSVTPLLAMAEGLKAGNADYEFLFLGTRQGPESSLVLASGIPFVSIPAGKFRRYFSTANLSDLINIVRGFFVAWRLLRQRHPLIILSAGSFVSVPVVWAGWFLGIPSLIHQQDVDPGLANRLMAQVARRITVTFDRSLKDFPANKTVLTGNPVRTELIAGSAERARQRFGLTSDLPVLLVLGGGTGALRLNELVVSASMELMQTLQILHLTGRGKQVIKISHQNYHEEPFLSTGIADAYAVADIVVSRAGLSTITELSQLGKPTILVPLPDSPQEANAQLLKEAGAAVVLNEKMISSHDLSHVIKQLLNDPIQQKILSQKISGLARPDALARIVSVVQGIISHG